MPKCSAIMARIAEESGESISSTYFQVQLKEQINEAIERRVRAQANADAESQAREVAADRGETGSGDFDLTGQSQEEVAAAEQSKRDAQAKADKPETDNGIALHEPGAQNEFYGLTEEEFDNLPRAQQQAHRNAVAAVDRLRRDKVSILANGVAADFKQRGAVSLIGQKVESLDDLAAAAQIHRNPRHHGNCTSTAQSRRLQRTPQPPRLRYAFPSFTAPAACAPGSWRSSPLAPPFVSASRLRQEATLCPTGHNAEGAAIGLGQSLSWFPSVPAAASPLRPSWLRHQVLAVRRWLALCLFDVGLGLVGSN